ncbi:hypothetical protein GFJ94_04915 [Flavobacterium sp. LMO8]|uniref:hypothetical protein n=1 Tax=Flavobacterium sp. LMO8 TaxID=2654244 RepID=UPI001292410A|nr:hypothetical protein [Flavobacterium sp. LMO8]MQP24400.1 hypothetical protein [Flavobacterium sp. LMO8]
MRKFLQIHLILILIGILLIYSVFDEKSYLRFIAIIGILIVLNSFVKIMRNSEEILHIFFPAKTIREVKPKFKDKIWQTISMNLFFLSLIFLIFEMDNLENTFEENQIWKTVGFSGIGLAIILLMVLNKIQPTIFDESGRRYSVIFGFIFGISALCISLTSFINREYSNKNVIVEKYTIVRKSTGGKRNGTHWIFINYMNNEIRFKISEQKWNEIKIGSEVEFNTQIGYLNYKYLENI